MTLSETLGHYRDLVNAYDACDLYDRESVVEIMKDLGITLSWLTEYRVTAHKKFMSVALDKGKTMSNAMAEKEAENEVPELYQLRYILKAGYEILNILRSHLSVIKQEN